MKAGAALGSLVVAAALAAGCAPAAPPAPQGPEPLPTVEVGEKPDAHASLAGEQVEKRPAAPAGVAGVLPEDFPRDLPLPEPSSLVDFGRGPHGGTRVVLEVQVSPEAARAAYERRLSAAGFESLGGGLWRRGARTVGVEVTPFSGAARIGLEVVASGG